jgi:hypothetical protein
MYKAITARAGAFSKTASHSGLKNIAKSEAVYFKTILSKFAS